jgi:hypothetical protein
MVRVLCGDTDGDVRWPRKPVLGSKSFLRRESTAFSGQRMTSWIYSSVLGTLRVLLREIFMAIALTLIYLPCLFGSLA